jgi:hypothetical protein
MAVALAIVDIVYERVKKAEALTLHKLVESSKTGIFTPTNLETDKLSYQAGWWRITRSTSQAQAYKNKQNSKHGTTPTAMALQASYYHTEQVLVYNTPLMTSESGTSPTVTQPHKNMEPLHCSHGSHHQQQTNKTQY